MERSSVVIWEAGAAACSNMPDTLPNRTKSREAPGHTSALFPPLYPSGDLTKGLMKTRNDKCLTFP